MSEPGELEEQKAALRKALREKISDISKDERICASKALCAKLETLSIWREAKSILLFAPMADEPDIWPVLEMALTAGKVASLPRFDTQSGTYNAAKVRTPSTDLIVGKFGIREPDSSCPEYPLNRLDLALVPGLGFDRLGGRLGRGKGFYDRLLKDVCGCRCGVAFDEQLVETIPVEPLDIRVNCILTPSRWIET